MSALIAIVIIVIILVLVKSGKKNTEITTPLFKWTGGGISGDDTTDNTKITDEDDLPKAE